MIRAFSPAVAIRPKGVGRDLRSTVGDRCAECRNPVRADTSAIVDRPLAEGEGARIRLLAPVVRDRKSRHAARSVPPSRGRLAE
ncbi:hypothetical protein PV726_18700 [Streptomyces europaeiscabiei]|uniref:hypothetical protein n=1 Tax=Streptomyces europaeiscabiei TaxID=146819 RepID=UPI0029B3B3EF|nr:hypothetical protein [Streptomyces europaeiscabiei]MDX3692334.1 hypothetical protein [Streptomyces europaeiscabiei]